MPSIFLWKADPAALEPRSTLSVMRGPGWWLEEEITDRPTKSRSIRVRNSAQITESVVALEIEMMPMDWVGEDVFEGEEKVPYQFYKLDPVFGRLERVGEWMRWMTSKEANKGTWEDAQQWIHARHVHRPAEKMEGDSERGGKRYEHHGVKHTEHVGRGEYGGRDGYGGRGGRGRGSGRGRGGQRGGRGRGGNECGARVDHFHETKKRQ